MKIEFLNSTAPGRAAAEAHIRKIYADAYGADVSDFAPLLVSVRAADGAVLCAAGIRLAQDGFFSDVYLAEGLSGALCARVGRPVPEDQIMEVVSLASATPFPVLPLLDAMITWGRERGMTCGVFTATAPLRRLLGRTGLGYTPLCAADPACLDDASSWGRYYETQPWVCAFDEGSRAPVTLSPRARRAAQPLRSEAS